MAPRGSKKQLATEHEDFVAREYRGRRSPTSGAAAHDQGDVRTADSLIECKGQFGTRVGNNPVRSTLVDQFEKIADEAYAEDKIPGLALRFYLPGSTLADPYGFVDFMVRLLYDDVHAQESKHLLERIGD